MHPKSVQVMQRGSGISCVENRRTKDSNQQWKWYTYHIYIYTYKSACIVSTPFKQILNLTFQILFNLTINRLPPFLSTVHTEHLKDGWSKILAASLQIATNIFRSAWEFFPKQRHRDVDGWMVKGWANFSADFIRRCSWLMGLRCRMYYMSVSDPNVWY